MPCSIENLHDLNALTDSGASTNLMPLCCYRKLGFNNPKEIVIILWLADTILKYLHGVVDNCSSKLEITSF